MESVRVRGLYYITHIANLRSILEKGVLSHRLVELEGIACRHIYDEGIVADRKAICTPDGRSLWDFANLYFNPRNPMLYRVLKENSVDDVVVIAVSLTVLTRPDVFITTGNARSLQSLILPQPEGMRRLKEILQGVGMEWWKEEDGTKRKIMAECLVPEKVPSKYFQAIYVANHQVANKVKSLLGSRGLPVIPEPHMFFRPLWRNKVTPTFFLVEGDMLFSQMQTLTVSVNCVGVMGKGLASRVKYQFPSVYVAYQDLCRAGKLQMGKPYLLRKELELSLDRVLADEPESLGNACSETWFLLFPTKRHWKERADIDGIEEGLRQVRRNYKRLGITSLAVPALGCGLGWLRWEEIGPLLFRYLSDLEIPVAVYLPREKKLPRELLSREFLSGVPGKRS